MEFWNAHRIRYQKEKKNPSGGTPSDFWSRPSDFGGQRTGFQVPLQAIEDMRQGLALSRADAFRWVSDEFLQAALNVRIIFGSPELTRGS